MSDQPAVKRAARPPLHRTVLRVATTAAAAATLVWSGLFYSAVSRHNAAAVPTAVAPAPATPAGASAATKATPATAPIVTHTS
jgi:hypothetical protein